jgi:hypothetical protein
MFEVPGLANQTPDILEDDSQLMMAGGASANRTYDNRFNTSETAAAPSISKRIQRTYLKNNAATSPNYNLNLLDPIRE